MGTMAFRRPDETLEEAVAAMFERARRNEEEAAPRKHHLVPASYLARWAPTGQLRVTVTDTKRTYTGSPGTVGRVTDFYSLASEDLDAGAVPPLLIETILSQIETAAKPLVDLLIEDGPGALTPLSALAFGQFLAFQVTRGRSFREQLMAIANAGQLLMWEGITDEGIAARLKENSQDDSPEAVAGIREWFDAWQRGEYRVGPQPAAQVWHAAAAAEPLALNLVGRQWRVYHSVLPLITCDEPVVPVHGPHQNRREVPGLATAGVVLLPLNPHRLLAMFHPYLRLDTVALEQELLPSEASELNVEIAANSDRWIFELVRGTQGRSILVPPHAPARAVVAAAGPGPTPGRELFRSHRPTRWHSSTPPALPVARWWFHSDGSERIPIDPDRQPYAMYNYLG